MCLERERKNMNKRKVGAEQEEKACTFLQSKGLKILERNYYTRQGEIDIIAKDACALVFVEVKYRKSISAGLPQEAVDRKKQRRISRAAAHYLSFHRLPFFTPCRFDVIAICDEEILWIPNAFCYIV